MSKTYILEPTEAEFTISKGELKAGVNLDFTALDGYPGEDADTEPFDTFLTNTFSGSKFEMMYGEEPISLIYSGLYPDVFFTVSGENVEGYPTARFEITGIDTLDIHVALDDGSGSPVAGTYTVSIYTETEEGDSGDKPPFTPERAGLPDMNVTLEYENPTNNGIALVTKAIMWNTIQDLNDPESELTDEEIAEINDILYNPGYAPMERLAKAIAFSKGRNGIDPYNIPEEDKSNYVVDFANDLERIAFAICPYMFAKSGSNDEAAEPANPGHEGSNS